MRVLFDTNIVLDVLLARAPHAAAAAQLFDLVERGAFEGYVGATTVTTIHYLATKAVGRARAKRHLRELLTLFEVAPVDREVLRQAMELDVADYEDAVLHEAARAADVSAIVTRDRRGFARASLPVMTPLEFLASLRAAES